MKGSKGTGVKRASQFFYDAFRASPIGIALENLEGRLLFVNPALCSMLGFSEEELLRKHCVDFSPPEDAEKDWLLFQKLKSGAIDNYHLDKRYFRRDGSLIWGRLSISLMKNEGSQMVVAMVEDITEKKAVQENLELAMKQNAVALRFQSLLSNLSRTFIGLPEEQVDANIERGLGQIGEFLEMDRIVLFEFSEDRTEMPTSYSWSALGVPKARPAVRTEAVPWCMEYLLRGEIMLVTNLNDLPDDALLARDFFQERGIISAAAIPLRLGNQINGGIVFITVRHEVSWSENLVDQLRAIGDIFWNALKRKRAHEAMLATQALMRESEERMSRKLLEAQEQERARIARELHDHINQRVALLSVAIQQITGGLPDGELRSRMDELEKQTWEISTDLQSLSHDLHSSKLEYFGLVLAMKGFCKEFGDKHKVVVNFDTEDVPSTVPQEVALCLFRVMQEGLRNAVKHSGVRFFDVKLYGSPTEIHLSIRDSGMGFGPEVARDTQGLGLISMQERVRLARGTIFITSLPESGTEIGVRLPLPTGMPMEQPKSAKAVANS